MNLAFINGEVIYDKPFNDYIIMPIPFLRCNHIEVIDI
jgi:hypothetical protein